VGVVGLIDKGAVGFNVDAAAAENAHQATWQAIRWIESLP